MASDVRPAKRLRMTEVRNEEYDVFLCHRGPDTKTAFVSFLYDRLEAAGLRPFLDCKSIGKGQHSQAWIDCAVKTTPIALVIFSENFADSEWCLKELKLMLDTPGVKVLPVFYKVQPDEVCCPEEGRLSAAFDELKRRHETSIEGWRDALKRASGLNGWVYEAAGQSLETDLVTAIVREVSELASKPLPLDVGDYVFGTEEVVNGIIQKLKGVSILVLWGMGGIGKSTLARELYNRMREEFAASCYVEELKSYYVHDSKNKVIRDDDIVKVQKHILKYLCPGEGHEVENKHKGKIILEERLSKKRILVVLDDVPDNGELYYWISRKMLTEGSMCIVTTRNRRVVEKLNNFDLKEAVHFHEVQGLGSEDSERVFASYAFGGYWNDKPPGFGELVAEISEACRGVPLVLKVCGALLKGREKTEFWSEVLMELKSGTFDDDGISDCLKMSFNALDQEYQDMFLDITCALLGQPRDLAILAWKSHGWYPVKGIQSLVDRALVTVDDSGCFRMHDHLRDMGRQILKEQRSKGVINRLSMPESLEYLRQNKGFPESLEVLNIINVDCSSLCALDISHMKNLRILMCDDTITATSIPENLCWWNLYGYGFNDFFNAFPERPVKEQMTTLPTPHPKNKLVVLSIADTRITILTEIVVRLSNLEVLNLGGCWKLDLLPESFGGLSMLRVLHLPGSGITSLPATFGELSNLEVLDLGKCIELDLLPESFGGLSKLRDLYLEGSGITSLPTSFGELSNLELLDVWECKELRLLPESFGGLSKLRDLNFGGSGIRSLPASFGELSNLEVLNLGVCLELDLLPESFGGLSKLQYLRSAGSGITRFPASFGELSNLEVLDVRGCRKLDLLPESFGGLSKLRDLKMASSGITSLPASFGELSNLEVLNLWACEKLDLLPESFGGLSKLRDLNLGWSGITSLPASFGELSNLEVLDVVRCWKLHLLPESFGGLIKLRDLKMAGSWITSLPASFGELSNLEVLDVGGCKKLHLLPESFGGLSKLRDLTMAGSEITSLPASIGELSDLEVLNLGDCLKLQLLPESFGGLSKLRELTMAGSEITSLPASIGELSKLEVLNLRECILLHLLPESFGGLIKLRDLNLKRSGIRSLPASFGELSKLDRLNLEQCEKMRLLPESFGGLRMLRDLNLKWCGITSLPASFGELSNLEVVNLEDCMKLHMLPESFGGLSKLRDLNLDHSGITTIPTSFGELKLSGTLSWLL